MSLILDALKKADEERHNYEATPSIDTNHNSEWHEPPKSNAAKYAAIASVVMIIAIAAVMWLNQSEQESSAQTGIATAKTPAEQTSQTPTTEPTQPPKTSEPQVAKPEMAQPEIMEEASQITTSTANNPVSTRPEATATQGEGKASTPSAPNHIPDRSADIAALYDEPPQPQTTAPQPTQSTQASHTQLPQSASQESNDLSSPPEEVVPAPNSIASLALVKTIKQLPFSSQEAIPTLMYSGHHYKKNGGSYVVINGKTLREKSTITSGIRVETIFVDGILLRNTSHQFKMQALSSWLNY